MKKVPLITPYITFDEVESKFRRVFESGFFTRGPYQLELKNNLRLFLGVDYVNLSTSATTALWMCLKILNVGPGYEIIVADFSFPASVNVIEDLGATPVFCDVNIETYNLDVECLKRCLSKHTKAVIFVDSLGNPSGIEGVKDFCSEHDVILIEDAACALGSSVNGQRCGSIADLTCFSFHPRKLVNSGEGGAITTSRNDWNEWFEIKLAHGAFGKKGIGLDFIDYGYNFRLTEIQSIMVDTQLARLESVIARRQQTRSDYDTNLRPLGFKSQFIDEGVYFNCQSVVFSVPSNCSRDGLVEYLSSRSIESTIGYYSLSDTSYYKKRYGVTCENSRRLSQNTITLPCFDGVDTTAVCKVIEDFMSIRT